MKNSLRFLAGLAFAAPLLMANAAVLSKDDLVREVAAPVANKTLQAVSLGVIQPGGASTAHAGTLAPDGPAVPDDHTLYEIGSITKIFTSLLLADAVVRGEVTLDTPIARLLPKDVTLPDGAGERITLRMLATHTSGLPRIPAGIAPDDYTNPYARYTEADLWATLRTVKLDFEPGTKASYSNLAAGLLGTLLAHQAGMTYEQLLATRIFAPLGMTETAVTLDDTQRSRYAPGFNGDGKPWPHWDFQALAGAGGIRSTTTDMMRFAAAVLHPEGTPLQKAIEFAWEKQPLAASVMPGGQALGWMLAGDGRTRWHNGMTGGFHAAVFINRELGVAVVLLANRSTPLGTQLAEALVRRAAGLRERPVPNANRAEITVTPEQIDRCVGTFRLSPEMVFVCERRNNALYVTPTGQPTDRLFAASPEVFFSRRAPAEIRFELPSDGGPATALLLVQGNRQTRAARE